MIACGALLLDMDGLMIDSEPLWFELQSNFVCERGGRWTPELASRCAGGGLDNAFRVIERALGVVLDIPQERAVMSNAFVERIDRLALKDGCLELIAAATHHRLPRAVASSSTTRLVHATLDRFALRPHFGAVVTGDSVERPKPAPDIFLAAAARLGVDPASCIVLEDALTGVAAARAAGMRVIAVPERSAAAFVDCADFVVSDLHAARRLLAL
ncbi:MAG TPA: HAD family phosphatase [Polyangiaceae bacterium]|nr:HAD family phosphatase [Polyangiaceae bacterium]